MKPLTKKRIIIWTSIAVILGVGGYFGYVKVLKPYLQRIKGEKDGEMPSESLTSSSPTPPPSSGGSVSNSNAYKEARQKAWDAKILAFSFQGKVYSTQTGKVIPNPFKNKEQLTAFQNFVITKMNDNSIGTADGIWGVKSAIAFIKYATQFYLKR
jgi:hypothetical protein